MPAITPAGPAQKKTGQGRFSLAGLGLDKKKAPAAAKMSGQDGYQRGAFEYILFVIRHGTTCQAMDNLNAENLFL
jgi:hypothetical protein